MRRWLLSALVLAALGAPAFAAAPKAVILEVSGMNCSLCPITVRKALERVPGVVEARVEFAEKRAQVRHDPQQVSPEVLAKAVSDAGFPAKVRQP